MFRIPSLPSYRTPGLRWRQKKDGSYEGRLYTTWPLRIATRLKPVKRIAIACAIIMCFGAQPGTSVPDYLAILVTTGISVFIYGYMLILVWPFWPLTKRVTMNSKHLSIGLRQYRLKDIETIQLHQPEGEGNGPFILVLHYANKFIQINVKNPGDQALNIAETLNEARQELLTSQPQTQVQNTATQDPSHNTPQNAYQTQRMSTF